MIEELKITVGAVIRAAEKCPEAKAVLRELFPQAFYDGWEPLTQFQDDEGVDPDFFGDDFCYQFRQSPGNKHMTLVFRKRI